MSKIESSSTAALFGGTILAMILGNVAIAQSPLNTNDQRKERCLELTALGTGAGDKPTGSKVEEAFHRFNLNILMDSVAVCRGAAWLFPNEKRLATGADHATKYFNLLLAGEKSANKSPRELFAMIAADGPQIKKPNAGKLKASLVGFFLGSWYEYGIGTDADSTKAIAWYGIAAKVGNKIAAREFARLNSSSKVAK